MHTMTRAALALLLLASTANAGPMSGYDTKENPVGADSVLINDSEAGNATKKATLTSIAALSPSMTYPGAGVANSTGSAWGTSYTVGTGASNLVQLNASAQLPAVSADLLTITDTGTYFTTDTVAAALQELGSGLADVTEITLDASLTETGGVLSVTNPATDYDTDGDGDFTDEAWFPVGTGYTDLTQYLTQTAWRLFYSDGSGNVKELALGDSGKVLQANGATSAPTWETPSGGTGGYLATPPTYSDEACTPGQYALSESYRWDCVATGNWNRTALTDWSNPSPVPPTLTSATVGTAGLYVDLLFSEAITAGVSGTAGWVMGCSTTGTIDMTYSSGNTTGTLSYSLSDTPLLNETCTVQYTQPGDGLEASDDGAELASIQSAQVTNNSTVTGSLWAVEDDFSVADSPPLTNYTEFIYSTNKITIGDGKIYLDTTIGDSAYAYSSTDLGSSSQVVEGVITTGAASGRASGLVLRSNGTSGHFCYPEVGGSRFTCNNLGGTGSAIYKSFSAGAWPISTSHRTQISVGADNVYKFEVDFNDDGDYLDENEQVGFSSANASFSGTKAGVGFRSAYPTETVDNFKARAQ